MRQEDRLKEKIGKKLPFKAPEGYFESFKSGLMDSLPQYPARPEPKRLSAWQRIRPYVYLAAMFAGIWCMMQIFHRVSTADNQQEEYAYVNLEPDSYDLYLDNYLDNSVGEDIEIEDEITELYPSFDEFKRDFYAQI